MPIRSAFVMAVPAVLLVAVAVAAGAHASSTAVSGVDSLTGGENWSQLCARVDKGLTKVGAVDARLHAGAETKGSLARLQARLDAATKAGDADRVRVLTDLMAMRASHAQTVTVKVAKLTDIQQVCRAHASKTTAG
jgi:hypothetical protein